MSVMEYSGGRPHQPSPCVASKIFLITCVRANFCAASVAFQGFGFLGHTFAFFIRSLYFEMQIIPSRPRPTCENRNHCSRRLCPPRCRVAGETTPLAGAAPPYLRREKSTPFVHICIICVLCAGWHISHMCSGWSGYTR